MADSSVWTLPRPTREAVAAGEAKKAGYIGNEEAGPIKQPPGSFAFPKRRWPSMMWIAPAVIDMRAWRFETYGMVDTPLSLTREELTELPARKTVEDDHCTANFGTQAHNFKGVDFRTILELTKPDKDVDWVIFECEGGLTMSMSLAKDMMLVYERNGQVLEPNHGYPLRLYSPGEWGFRNVKWLRRVKFCEERELDYWASYFYLRGMDPEVLDAGYDGFINDDVDPEAMADFDTFVGNKVRYDQRREMHLKGPRGYGFSERRAPLYVGDSNWSPENWGYVYGPGYHYGT
ncbi:molybdopterin-dependent oxidoreductase [Pimelobacter simplex]|uniref:molybdopterin-dependent oxidoreductase n=1 Tax=Nocardioides simplex TaxID=2045 RepID=UPI0021502329|nr:molybdopterin-dependent oxidoreductase [Pimelobacter simplex]UUW92524.1 molybdopterin-dependent oxidoreductase [Pimelobacter simplex]UUW96352.1 molybdopterin-dependent oxidoreductase [Pimelobacter simplex]